MEFIDLHCHMAWDIDDGFESREDAEKALHQAREDGICGIVATPHFIPGVHDSEDVMYMNRRIRELREAAASYGIEVYSGSEVFLNDDYLDMIDRKECNTLNDTRYLLCEFDVRKDIDKNEQAEEQLYELAIRGFVPIIAHVERYFHGDIDTGRVRAWIDEGYVIQMNRTSLLGMHGKQMQKNARKLLQEGLVHVAASDAHRPQGKRICRMSDVYACIGKEAGRETADILCRINPGHILRDEDVERSKAVKRSRFQVWKRR